MATLTQSINRLSALNSSQIASLTAFANSDIGASFMHQVLKRSKEQAPNAMDSNLAASLNSALCKQGFDNLVPKTEVKSETKNSEINAQEIALKLDSPSPSLLPKFML